MATEVKLPELAEGVDTGDVLSVAVREGDIVEADAPLMELETGKATVTLPAPAKGKVSRVMVKAGDKVRVGQTLFVLDDDTGAQPAVAEASAQPAPAEAAPPKPEPAAPPAQPAEPKSAAAESRPPAESKNYAERSAPASQEVLTERSDEDREHGTAGHSMADDEDLFEPELPSPEVQGHPSYPAGPAVRRIARELHIDLGAVKGSGPKGRILVEDLDPHIQSYIAQRGGGRAPAATAAQPELPDFSKWGPVRREKMSSLRRKIAENLARAWAATPHVHQFHEVDVTHLVELQKRYRERSRQQGGPALTLMPFIMKAVTALLKEFPKFNSSFDPGAEEIIYKDYYDIGVAVDTPAGLVVPVVRAADTKPILQLAAELAELSQRTRDRKVSPEELQGSTFTISNLGSIGGGAFTPIVNSPNVAILGTARAAARPVYIEGSIQPRSIMPLCLGYDHRVIDGAEGARFVVRLAEILEDFEALALGF